MSKLFLSQDYFNNINTLYNKHSDFTLSCAYSNNVNGVIRYTLYFPRTGSTTYYNYYYYQYDDLLNDYILKWDGETNSLPTSSCMKDLELTTDFYYRRDFPSILLMFFLISIICFYFPFKIFSRAFGRWFKL